MKGGVEEIQEFLKNTTFQKKMEEAKDKYLSIFICELKPKTNKKVSTSLIKAYAFLNKIGKEIISKNYGYLLDESNDYKIIRSEPGFNIPVKKDDLTDLLDLLIKDNEKNKLGFFIDVSHKNPFSNNQFIKIQFKNIPPDVDKIFAKNMFNTFGEIQDIYHKDGIWTVLFQKINWSLPYAYHQHIKTGSKDRWFSLGEALCSFSSKIPCSNCHIKGHSKLKCPGQPLLEKLGKEEKDQKEEPKKPIPTKQKKDSVVQMLGESGSDSDLDISSDVDVKIETPPKRITRQNPVPSKNKVITPEKGKKDKDKKTPKKRTKK